MACAHVYLKLPMMLGLCSLTSPDRGRTIYDTRESVQLRQVLRDLKVDTEMRTAQLRTEMDFAQKATARAAKRTTADAGRLERKLISTGDQVDQLFEILEVMKDERDQICASYMLFCCSVLPGSSVAADS